MSLLRKIAKDINAKGQFLFHPVRFYVPLINIVGGSEHKVAGNEEARSNELSVCSVAVIQCPNTIIRELTN